MATNRRSRTALTLGGILVLTWLSALPASAQRAPQGVDRQTSELRRFLVTQLERARPALGDRATDALVGRAITAPSDEHLLAVADLGSQVLRSTLPTLQGSSVGSLETSPPAAPGSLTLTLRFPVGEAADAMEELRNARRTFTFERGTWMPSPDDN